MRKFLTLCLAAVLVSCAGCGGGDETPPETLPEAVAALRSEGQFEPPVFSYLPEYDPVALEDPRVKAIAFDSVSLSGTPTKVFAYLGLPETATRSEPVPGVVLIHGGGGTAYPEWVKKWVDAGYAALAVDTEGNCNPAGGSAAAGTTGSDPENRFAGPSNDGFGSSFRPLREQWMYHAVSAAIGANSLLRGDPRVDPSRVGITGISWGGIITSIAMGADERFCFAVPVYNSGCFREGIASFGGDFFDEKTIETWDPSLFFGRVGAKVLFVNSDHDGFNSLNQTNACRQKLPGSLQSVHPDLIHGHVQGWEPAETMAFADACVGKTAQNMVVLTSETADGRKLEIGYDASSGAAAERAEVFAIAGEYAYASAAPYQAFTIREDFKKVNAAIRIEAGKIAVELPEGLSHYYVNVITAEGLITSTNLRKLS